MLGLISKGIVIGVLVSAPMGPIGMLCIQRTLNKGRWHGFVTGLGAALSDVIYAALTCLGMGVVVNFVEANQAPLQLIGSIVLGIFGYYIFQSNPVRKYLADHDVVTEITPTERAAMFRFTFPESDNSYVIVDAFDRGSYVKIIPEENKIIGYTTRNSGGVPQNFRNYFVVVFDKPFTYKASVGDD